jgi:hypothetical protein
MKAELDALVGPIALLMNPESQEEKDLKALIDFSEEGENTKVKDGTKDTTLKALLAEYGAADPAAKGAIDTRVKALKNADGKDLSTMLRDAKAAVAHLGATPDPAVVKGHHAAVRKAFGEGQTAAKPTDAQVAGAALLDEIEQYILAGNLEWTTEIPDATALKDPKNVKKVMALLASELGKTAGLESANARLTAELGAARAASGASGPGGVPGMGAGGGGAGGGTGVRLSPAETADRASLADDGKRAIYDAARTEGDTHANAMLRAS